jgi:hypothetical protein
MRAFINGWYYYGMRLRGFSIGCLPKEGYIDRRDDDTGKYRDILIYNRELTEDEIQAYNLDFIRADMRGTY